MIVLDTTVLVHAVGDDHDLREPARAIGEAVESGSVQATTTVEAVRGLRWVDLAGDELPGLLAG